MAAKICEDCGSNVYALGCVNCDEVNYIEEQEQLTELQYPDVAADRSQEKPDAMTTR